MIDSVRQRETLHFFEDGLNLKGQPPTTCFNSISVASDNEILLSHFKLGHPNF